MNITDAPDDETVYLTMAEDAPRYWVRTGDVSIGRGRVGRTDAVGARRVLAQRDYVSLACNVELDDGGSCPRPSDECAYHAEPRFTQTSDDDSAAGADGGASGDDDADDGDAEA